MWYTCLAPFLFPRRKLGINCFCKDGTEVILQWPWHWTKGNMTSHLRFKSFEVSLPAILPLKPYHTLRGWIYHWLDFKKGEVGFLWSRSQGCSTPLPAFLMSWGAWYVGKINYSPASQNYYGKVIDTLPIKHCDLYSYVSLPKGILKFIKFDLPLSSFFSAVHIFQSSSIMAPSARYVQGVGVFYQAAIWLLWHLYKLGWKLLKRHEIPRYTHWKKAHTPVHRFILPILQSWYWLLDAVLIEGFSGRYIHLRIGSNDIYMVRTNILYMFINIYIYILKTKTKTHGFQSSSFPFNSTIEFTKWACLKTACPKNWLWIIIFPFKIVIFGVCSISRHPQMVEFLTPGDCRELQAHIPGQVADAPWKYDIVISPTRHTLWHNGDMNSICSGICSRNMFTEYVYGISMETFMEYESGINIDS